MSKKNLCVCIHGHFYQPPRENPWIEEIEQQASAAPFHDWNERIHHECYLPNTKARVLDEKGNFEERYNPQLVQIMRLREETDTPLLKNMIAQHLEYTASKKAKDILTHWSKYAPKFWRVEPHPTETKIRMEVVVNINRDDQGRPIPNEELAKNVKGK